MSLGAPTTALWATLLVAAGFASNSFLTCGSNLVGCAAVAALTLGLRRGSLVALAIWLESQILGFTVLGYPHTVMTYAWGAALGAGVVIVAAIAHSCAPRGRIFAFALAFFGYEAALAAFSLATGGGLADFTFTIVAQVLISNAAVALGGALLYRVVSAADGNIAEAFARKRRA